jgi:methionyl-tRNA formyltransferase
MSMDKKRILFLGSHLRSADCLERLVQRGDATVVGLVLNRSESGDYDPRRIREIAARACIAILQFEEVAALEYELGVSILFDRKIPAAMVDRPRDGIVNLHLGPLPSLRGVNSVYHAIIRARPNNEWKFGVTLHYMDHGLDTGPVIDKCEIPIQSNDFAFDLYMRATGEIPNLFARNTERLVSTHGRVAAEKQVGISNYFGRKDMRLDVDLTASPDEIYDAVRALTFPGKPKPFAWVGAHKLYLSLSE